MRSRPPALLLFLPILLATSSTGGKRRLPNTKGIGIDWGVFFSQVEVKQLQYFGDAILYLTQKLSSTLQLFREGPAAQARKQFLNSSAGRCPDSTFTLRAWAAGVIALLSLEPEDNRLKKYF